MRVIFYVGVIILEDRKKEFRLGVTNSFDDESVVT